MKKKIVIEVDVVSGEIELLNEDDLSYIEILGMIEYGKMMIITDWQESD